jgi:site-specific DNA-methyltransferase (adenine-specific)
MSVPHKLFRALGVSPDDPKAIRHLASRVDIPLDRLRFLDLSGTFPTGKELVRILAATGQSELELKLKLCCFDMAVAEGIRQHAPAVAKLIAEDVSHAKQRTTTPKRVLKTKLGSLFQGDCTNVLAGIADESIDLIFADPPFNLNKLYPSGIDDNLKAERYLGWCEEWINECARTLKMGGSFFLWNLPKWNAVLSGVVGRRLTFRHWIAVDIKYTLPIAGRLYPSHYGLLYFVKGDKPNTFKPDRLPMEVCPNCKYDLKDYGGYKDKMNPEGVNLSDVWYDIPPVRHAKYKRRKEANELSIKLLDRIIEMASEEGDIVFDPFGGSGTTYVVSEIKRRRWIGVEVGPTAGIEARFERIAEEAKYLRQNRQKLNLLFSPETARERIRRGLWTVESERARKAAIRGSDHTPELDFG